MKKLFTTIILFFFISVSLYSQDSEINTVKPDQLVGEWLIDLRPTPDAEEYYQTFFIKGVVDKSFTGTFYGSALENTLLNTNWEKLYFAFTTQDSNHSYYHSGYLIEGTLYGITYCPGRNFTAPWTGKKK